MMAPTMVLRDGTPELVLGSAGSNRIRSAILQTICRVIDEGMRAREAVEAPRAHYEDGVVYTEPGIDVGALEAEGRTISAFHERNLFFGGVQAVQRDRAGGFWAAATLAGAARRWWSTRVAIRKFVSGRGSGWPRFSRRSRRAVGCASGQTAVPPSNPEYRQGDPMGFDQYHEPPDELPAATRTFARLCASLTEEAEAIGWYEQRIAVETDPDARAVMADAQGEEFKHFSMDLELLLRRTPPWRAIAAGSCSGTATSSRTGRPRRPRRSRAIGREQWRRGDSSLGIGALREWPR